MKRRLILITNSFPYGVGEVSFIKPELSWLTKQYDITIISRNAKELLTTDLTKEIEVVRYDSRDIKLTELMRCFGALFDREVICEVISNKLDHKKNIALCKYIIRAKHFSNYVRRVTKKYKQEIVFYCYWNDYSAYGIAELCKKTSNKCISRIHGGDLYLLASNGYYQPMKKSIAKWFDRIVFISEAGRQYFIDNYNPSSSKNLVVHRMGVNNDLGTNEGSGDKILRIISLSNINKGKRVDLIVRALALINEINVEWTHIGDGEERENVESLAKETLDKKNNINYEFVGRLDNIQVKQFLLENPIDLLLNVSDSEGIPVSMMEAASFGIAIVGTNVGGVKEIVKTENGFLLSKDFESEELKNILLHYWCMSDSEKISMRMNSKSMWEKEFEANKNYQRFLQEVESVWED